MVSPLIVSLKKQRNFYGSKIEILSPAKINLYLNITGRYSSGFHKLESIVERISLSDVINIKIKKNSSIDILSNIKNLQTKDNLVYKAALLMKRKFAISCGFDIYLKKNIPIGSGLGGGSSNAASTVLAITKLLGLTLTKKELYFLGAKLGSDVNFFIADSKFAFLEGRGERVTPIEINKIFQHFIIWPAIEVSTAKVYNNISIKLTKFFNNANILKYALRNNDAYLVDKSIFNVLENKSLATYSKLKKVKDFLLKNNVPVKLTGSGSAFYTVFSRRSLKQIKALVPSEWCVFKVNTF